MHQVVKRGYDTLNLVPLQTGNTQVMETLLKALFKINMTVQSGVLTLAQDWGSFIRIIDWLQGGLFPLPTIPIQVVFFRT